MSSQQGSGELLCNFIHVRCAKFATLAAAPTCEVAVDLTWARLEANPILVNEADISTQSAQASIEKNTVPCIPAGPKSCLVRKMAWSWYSSWSGSWRCCVLAHRHTCSRLRDGLPRSIRLIDCRSTKRQKLLLRPLNLQLHVIAHLLKFNTGVISGESSRAVFPLRKTS